MTVLKAQRFVTNFAMLLRVKHFEISVKITARNLPVSGSNTTSRNSLEKETSVPPARTKAVPIRKAA